MVDDDAKKYLEGSDHVEELRKIMKNLGIDSVPPEIRTGHHTS